MEIKDQHRDEAKEAATLAQHFLFSDYRSGQLLYSIAEKYKLDETNRYKSFAIIIGDIILGFYDTKDIKELLIQELGISDEIATPLTNDVREFLSPLDDPNWQPPVEEPDLTLNRTDVDDLAADQPGAVKDERPEATTVSPAESIPVPDNPAPEFTDLQKSIADLETQMTETPSLRTMAQDMQSARSPQRSSFDPISDDGAPTHISNQSEAPTITVTETETAEEEPATRWG